MKNALEVVSAICSGMLGQREAEQIYNLSGALIYPGLRQYEAGELKDDTAATLQEYESRMALLARKVGQLTVENDLLKKAVRIRVAQLNARF